VIFIKLGQILAYGAIIIGLFRAISAIVLVSSGNSPTPISRYLGSGTSGEIIDESLYMALCGVLIGILTVIAKNTLPTNRS